MEIEVHLIYDGVAPQGPATLTLFVGDVQVGQGRVDISVPAGFTASESFDVGTDLGSPVSLDYYECEAPFTFNGTIDSLHIRYLTEDDLQNMRISKA